MGFQCLGVFLLLGIENPAGRGNAWDGAEKPVKSNREQVMLL